MYKIELIVIIERNSKKEGRTKKRNSIGRYRFVRVSSGYVCRKRSLATVAKRKRKAKRARFASEERKCNDDDAWLPPVRQEKRWP